jgi:hypothetical protein
VVFGGRHADVPIITEMGAALGRMIANEALVCDVDLSELGSNAARRRLVGGWSLQPRPRRVEAGIGSG